MQLHSPFLRFVPSLHLLNTFESWYYHNISLIHCFDYSPVCSSWWTVSQPTCLLSISRLCVAYSKLCLLNLNRSSTEIPSCQNVREKIQVSAQHFRQETNYLWRSSGRQCCPPLNVASKSDAYESFTDAEIARVLELLHVLLLTAFSQLPCAFPTHFFHVDAVLSSHLN